MLKFSLKALFYLYETETEKRELMKETLALH